MATTIHDPNMEKRMEKHMGGCMSGFFNIFDRSHRLYPKRLPPPGGDSASETMSCSESPAMSMEFEKPKPQQQPEVLLTPLAKEITPSPKCTSPASTWKFNREVPRLSLDSRAITDGKGGLRPRQIQINTNSNNGSYDEDDEGSNKRKSPSVIARLMGLEPLPSSDCSDRSSFEPEKKSELRRSASESRSRDYRFIDGNNFFSAEQKNIVDRQQINNNNNNNNNNKIKIRNQNVTNNSNNQRKTTLERRSYYDTTDFFPAEIPAKLQHQPVMIYGEIERRLKTKGMEEPMKDLETLKHILEALQLKGLFHSSTVKKPVNNNNRRFFDNKEESSIVLMKPASSRPTSPTQSNRRRNQNGSTAEPALSPRRDRPVRNNRTENRSLSPGLRRKGGMNANSPVQSPRLNKRSDQSVNKSPRNRKSSCFTEDEMSTDSEMWRVEEYKNGRSLLQRCDKLLHNIAEITAKSGLSSNSIELQQPSPVSVLDSSFYDELSPSPVKKRVIDFKDHQAEAELEDELTCSPSSSSKELFDYVNDVQLSGDLEFVYVSEVIRAYNYLPEDDNLFYLLEKHNGIGQDKSKVSVLQRKLIFDTVTEILDHIRQLPPWKSGRKPRLEEIWAEFNKIREQTPSEDLIEVICGALKKDLGRDSVNGWTDLPIQMSDAVFDIERLIFKDLIGESIQDLASDCGKRTGLHGLCRKLVF